jgi:hypothetical protein
MIMTTFSIEQYSILYQPGTRRRDYRNGYWTVLRPDGTIMDVKILTEVSAINMVKELNYLYLISGRG